MTMLMEDDARHTAIRSCRYCPMCHHADLTVTLERRETYSARGRGLLLFSVEQGETDWNAELADVMYRYFTDGLCRHVCAGHIPHDELIIDARRRLVAANQAPAAVTQVKSNIETTGNPWGEREPDLSALAGASDRADVLLYFGSTARIRRPESMKAWAELLRKCGVAFSVLREEADPGLLLYQLGHFKAAVTAARRLAEKIEQSGARTIVTPDADAFRTLKAGFADSSPISGPAIQHASEFVSGLGDDLAFLKPTSGTVAYHDPCALARFAPCLDAPRALIGTVCNQPPIEIGSWSRDRANCSGECGGVTFTHPALAHKAAVHRTQEARNAGADLLVAGSPASASALEHAGMPVIELGEFLARSLA